MKHSKVILSIKLIVFCLMLFVFFLLLIKNMPKASDDYSFVVYDTHKQLLNATVSSDEQWRFPQTEKLSKDYINCVILYEDKNFYFHNAVDPAAVLRAIILNIKNKRIVSGASTLTMQLARILEHNKPRTMKQKIKEACISILLEIAYTKDEILNQYANNAPYGGNVVGMTAASWRYFSRPQTDLSISELAVLSVLPNEPALVRPGSHETKLVEKRNKVLQLLLDENKITEEQFQLFIREEVPTAPANLPNIIPHYSQTLKQKTKAYAVTVDIDIKLQQRVSDIVEALSAEAAKSNVYNAAAIILENSSGKVLSYVGNTGIKNINRVIENEQVDIVQAPRSSGSLLKPFLYAASIDQSIILPTQILKDTPMQFGSYIPQNNTHYFLGAVAANEALTKSLNVPFVHLLTQYSIDGFLDLLHKLKFTTFTKSADHYGLPLILGGGEITLFEIADAYRRFAECALKKDTDFPVSSAACRITLDNLINGVRPNEEDAWRFFSTSKQIAWKTGTSYGNKDAWCVGVTPLYTVAVWVGNASGVGRPEITSTKYAAPLMFKLFELLDNANWPPHNEFDYKTVTVCKHSGYIAGSYCDERMPILIPKNTFINGTCPYCIPVQLTSDRKFRLTDIASVNYTPIIKNYFCLPPVQEYYFSQAHPDYEKLPPVYGEIKRRNFQIIFPENFSRIFIPTNLDGTKGSIVARAAYPDQNRQLFWYLDSSFIALTENIHEVKISAPYGRHTLTVTDDGGNEQSVVFFVLSE